MLKQNIFNKYRFISAKEVKNDFQKRIETLNLQLLQIQEQNPQIQLFIEQQKESNITSDQLKQQFLNEIRKTKELENLNDILNILNQEKEREYNSLYTIFIPEEQRKEIKEKQKVNEEYQQILNDQNEILEQLKERNEKLRQKLIKIKMENKEIGDNLSSILKDKTLMEIELKTILSMVDLYKESFITLEQEAVDVDNICHCNETEIKHYMNEKKQLKECISSSNNQ